MEEITEKRIYANEHYYETRDTKLLELFDNLMFLHDTKNSYLKYAHQWVCNTIRNNLGISNVIGLSLNSQQDALLIFVYDVDAVEGVYFEQKFDTKLNKFYIENKKEEL